MNGIGFPNTDMYSDHESVGEESFWPSFTDIMMVIVMTFLLITVAVILKNWELINHLKSSIEAERQATVQAQTALQVVELKSKENETLEERLARLEQLLNKRTQSLQQARQLQQQTVQRLNISKQQVSTAQATLQTTLQTMEQEKIKYAETLANTQRLLEEQQQRATALEKEKDASVVAANQAEANLVSVQQKLENSGKELEALKQKDLEGHERLVSLQGEFNQLDKKYQKLLRPARSTKNKHVVRVVFNKSNGKVRYQLGDQGQSALETYSKKRLNSKLSQLKKRYGDDLYVKIIIPKGSQVSHSEAWKFTSEILNKYDYYHSEKNE